MHTVTLDGVEYTKATEVAKQFGYTSDYLGQLCRAKKVNARLVGRSWFLNVPSLEKHQSARYQNSKKSSTKETRLEVKDTVKKADIPSKKYLKRVSSPEPRLRRIQDIAHGLKSSDSQPARYESDDGALLPRVQRSPKVTLLKVSVAESERLHISSSDTKGKTLAPSALPEVVLSGSVNVLSIPDEEVEPDLTGESEINTPSESKKLVSPTRDKSINKVKIRKEPLESQNDTRQKEGTRTQLSKQKRPETEKVVAKRQSTSSVSKSKLKVVNIEESHDGVKVAPEVPISSGDDETKEIKIDFRLQAMAVVTGVVIGVSVLSAEYVLTIVEEEVISDIQFAWSNVKNFASVLFTG